jgi:hypothetical protein
MQAIKWVKGLGTLTEKTIILGFIALFGYAFSLSAIAQTETEVTLPPPFIAKYDALRHDKKIGTARLSLSLLEASKYKLDYQSKVSRFFLSDKRYETSIFNYAQGVITPTKYEFSRKGTGPNKSLKVVFDNKKREIKINKTETLKWEGEYDNQLFRIDISRQLAAGKSQFEYKFLNYRGEKRSYSIEVVKTENVDLPFGQLEAIKVKVNRDSNKRQTYAWFAPSLDFVLVRLQQFKEGEEQGDIQLSSYSTQ